MSPEEVLDILEANKNEKGIAHWKKLYPEEDALDSYGIGLTVLRKLGKQIGRNHELAEQLWNTNNYDAKILSLLIDDPKKMSIPQAESKITGLKPGYLAHVFSSCDASLAKTSFVNELADQWILASDRMRRRCGYGLLYEISKSKKKSAPDESYFLDYIEQIKSNYINETNPVKGAMIGALIGIGKRTSTLNKAAIKCIKDLNNSVEGELYQPYDAMKHLTSDYITKKLGLTKS